MKFLCVPCDTPLKLHETRMPEPGSVSLVYGCPACGWELAMLTNPHETQVVGSLGIKLGAPEAGGGEAGAAGCPFTGMVRELAADAEPGRLGWTPAAEARIAAVPELVRPFVRAGIESFARERGYGAVDERVLDEARSRERS